MYAIVKKVVTPPITSRESEESRAAAGSVMKVTACYHPRVSIPESCCP
jgi:hypothetical protein